MLMKKHLKTLTVLLGLSLGNAFSGCGRVDPPTDPPVVEDENSEHTEAPEVPVSTEPDPAEEPVFIPSVESEAEDGPEHSDTNGEEISILMAGDILLHDPIEEIAKEADGSFDFHFLFRETAEQIRSADIAIVNQEVIIGGKDLGISGYPTFNAPEEIGDALADSGFDVVCHATNHALDKGKAGIQNTLSMWGSAHPDMEIAGIRTSEEKKDRFPVVQAHGIRIAILNYTSTTNGIPMPPDMPYAVDLLQEDTVKSDLEEAEQTADLTVVCPHWGTEYSHEVSEEQLFWMEFFREHGADVVIGTHPHVIEPIGIMDAQGFSPLHEAMEAPIPNNHGDGALLIFSSIGNFCNWTSGTGSGVADRMLGGLACVRVQKDPEGAVFVAGSAVLPVICHVSENREEFTVYPIDRYSEELGEKNEIRSQDPAFSYEYCLELCDRIWGGFWKQDILKSE